uniref:IgGFc_binding domain-containing protein n=1 Tax=Parastrongyloides trichosuri TaxID=131310 RepID=A0A0N4ZQ11_PARTI
MNYINFFALLFVTIVSTTYCYQDSDGTSFITSFLYKDALIPSNFSLSLYFLPRDNVPTTVSISYYSLKNKAINNLTLVAIYNQINQQTFDYNDVISEFHPSSGHAWNVTDPRIFIQSTAPIKVIARLYNTVNNQGDMYIVPPTTFAGTKYLVKLPQTAVGKLQLLHILAVENQNVFVNVITTTPGANATFNQSFYINGALGQPQRLISVLFTGPGKSFYITSTYPILITAAVNGADLNAYSSTNTTSTNNYDYAAFIPQPIGEWNCKTMLTPKDRRVTVADHTVALDVAPSDVACWDKLPILTYTNQNIINGTSITIPVQQVTEFPIDHLSINEFATTSSHAVAIWTRIGSPKASNSGTLNGMYIHYIPETTQFYNGSTQFIALNGGDYLEVYIENLQGSDTITLNGIPIFESISTTQTLDFFNKTYIVYKLNAPLPGVYTFNCSANYIAYLISKSNNQTNTAYGYLTGFNKSKLQTYWAADSTTVAPTTSIGPINFSTTPKLVMTTTKVSSSLMFIKIKLIMKFITYILSILSVLAYIGSCNDDTYGTNFVTSFLYKNALNPTKMHLSLFFLPRDNVTTTVTVSWYSLVSKQQKNTTINAVYHEQNPLVFDYSDVVSDGHIASGHAWNVTDPRIIISSNKPVKVYARLFNTANNQGDVYLVPPVLFAGQKFLFSLPESVALTNQLVHILALPNNDATVQIIQSSPNGTVLLNQTVSVTGALGGNQRIVPIMITNGSPSIYINANTSIVIVAAVKCANLNAYNSNNATSSNTCDYAAFMPQQIRTWDCQSSLLVQDKRVISGDHTISVGISPADTTCNSPFPVLSYTNLNSILGVNNSLPTKQVTNFQVIHSLINEYATESQKARISLSRVGSPKANKNQTLDGIYIHYIPETTQYYSGKTQFVTFTDGDHLEVYVSNLKINDNITLNGIPLINGLINSQVIYSFGSTYNVFKLNANRIGLHTFSCTAKYIAYVVSKTNKNTNTAYGYVTGYGISQLVPIGGSTTTLSPLVSTVTGPTTTTASAGPTQTVTSIPLTTTTKGTSNVSFSFILGFLSFSLLLIR